MQDLSEVPSEPIPLWHHHVDVQEGLRTVFSFFGRVAKHPSKHLLVQIHFPVLLIELVDVGLVHRPGEDMLRAHPTGTVEGLEFVNHRHRSRLEVSDLVEAPREGRFVLQGVVEGGNVFEDEEALRALVGSLFTS